MKKKTQIIVAASNAGGAQVLSSLVAAEKKNCAWHIIVPGGSPAFAVFKNNCLGTLIVDSCEKPQSAYWMDRIKPDFLFCGTAWGNLDFELSFIREARKRLITAVSFLDHWCNFRERFGYPRSGWEKDIADFIAVSDLKAFQLASGLGLPNLVKIKNYYFSGLLKKHKQLCLNRKVKENCLLIFSEPISMRAKGYAEFSEYGLINDVLSSFNLFAASYGLDEVVIRLHPSENKDKYDYCLEKFSKIKLRIEDPGRTGLLHSLHKSGLSVGFESLPLFAAYLLKKRFISYAPVPNQSDIPLPQECRLRGLSEFRKADLKKVKFLAREWLFPENRDLSSLLASVAERRRG